MKHDNATALRQWARLRELARVPALTESEAHEVADLATALDVKVVVERVNLGDTETWPHRQYYQVGGRA